jgi:hypothetical protein
MSGIYERAGSISGAGKAFASTWSRDPGRRARRRRLDAPRRRGPCLEVLVWHEGSARQLLHHWTSETPYGEKELNCCRSYREFLPSWAYFALGCPRGSKANLANRPELLAPGGFEFVVAGKHFGGIALDVGGDAGEDHSTSDSRGECDGGCGVSSFYVPLIDHLDL